MAPEKNLVNAVKNLVKMRDSVSAQPTCRLRFHILSHVTLCADIAKISPACGGPSSCDCFYDGRAMFMSRKLKRKALLFGVGCAYGLVPAALVSRAQ